MFLKLAFCIRAKETNTTLNSVPWRFCKYYYRCFDCIAYHECCDRGDHFGRGAQFTRLSPNGCCGKVDCVPFVECFIMGWREGGMEGGREGGRGGGREEGGREREREREREGEGEREIARER